MEKLTEEIKAKAGVSEEQAKIASETAVAFIKLRVAQIIDSKVDEAVSEMSWKIKSEVHEAVTGEPLATFSEKMQDYAESAKDRVEDFAEDAQEKFGEFTKSAKSFFGWGKDKKDEEKKIDKKEKEDK